MIPANSAGAIFDLRTDPENVSYHAWISNDSQKSERSTMDQMVDETVRGEPVSPVCQPVDTLAAVDKAVVDSWL